AEVLELEAEHQGPVLLELPKRVVNERLRVGGGQHEAFVGISELDRILDGRTRIEVVADRCQQAPPVRQLQSRDTEDVLLIRLFTIEGIEGSVAVGRLRDQRTVLDLTEQVSPPEAEPALVETGLRDGAENGGGGQISGENIV